MTVSDVSVQRNLNHVRFAFVLFRRLFGDDLEYIVRVVVRERNGVRDAHEHQGRHEHRQKPVEMFHGFEYLLV